MLLIDELVGYAKANAEAAKTQDERETWGAHHRNCLKVREEIQQLRSQIEGLALAALNNGQGLLIYERALEQIKDLSDSEDGEPLDDAIRIAEQALAFKAPELKFDPR